MMRLLGWLTAMILGALIFGQAEALASPHVDASSAHAHTHAAGVVLEHEAHVAAAPAGHGVHPDGHGHSHDDGHGHDHGSAGSCSSTTCGHGFVEPSRPDVPAPLATARFLPAAMLGVWQHDPSPLRRPPRPIL